MSYLFFKIINLDNMRFKNTSYSAFPFKERNIINLSKNPTPPVVNKYLNEYEIKNKNISLILLASTNEPYVTKDLPIYEEKYNNLNIELIKKHCSKDEFLLLKFHQTVSGSHVSEKELVTKLTQLDIKLKILMIFSLII